MANHRRGEIDALIGGEMRVLCLTLGALAELESAFAVRDLTALGERFAQGRLSAHDIVTIAGAGLRGGGMTISNAEVAALAIEGGVVAWGDIVARLLRASFGVVEEIPPRPL